MRRKSNPEQAIHKAIIDYLNMFPSKLLAVTIKNTGTMRDGVYCPSKTTILGISDIIVFPRFARTTVMTSASFLPFFVEVKTPSKTSRQSVNQVGFQKMVEALGYSYEIVRSVEDMQVVLKKRGII